MKNDWFIIINPRAGSGKTMKEWLPAEKKLVKYQIPMIQVYTERVAHATELAYNAAKDGYRKILAVGGDGSLHETFRGIMLFCDETGTPPSEFYLGVAPIGSGNDWIKSLGVDHNVEHVIKLMHEESFGVMDIVKMFSSDGSVSYMANVGGTGFDAHVCERANAVKSLGWRNKMLYVRALRYTIAHTHRINIQVLVDGREIFSGAAYSVALGNGKYSGGGMRQVPAALIDDGQVDIMIVPKMPVNTLLKEIPKLFSGTLSSSKHVKFGRGKEIQIIPLDISSHDIAESDGEIEGNLPLTIKATGETINVIKG